VPAARPLASKMPGTPGQQTMSIAQLETLYDAAAAALESGDYDAAIAKALGLKLRLAAMPDVERAAIKVLWANVGALDSFISECRRLKATAIGASGGPFQSTPITYARPNSVDGF
jgi:hypothetical protein